MTTDPRTIRDAGVTVIELLFSIVIFGIVTSTLSMTVVTSLRVAPDTETRIDDARATRSLATWLATDTISTPPFMPEQAQGGIVLDQNPSATDNNDCTSSGTNLLHLQWAEATDQVRTFVSNYRWKINADGTGSIVRHLCVQTGAGPFVDVTSRTVTSGLTPSQPPTITPIVDGVTGDVTMIRFELVGDTGEVVQVDTGSRNPADFFP